MRISQNLLNISLWLMKKEAKEVFDSLTYVARPIPLQASEGKGMGSC